MFNLGLFEMTLFGVIALIVLGPEKLPIAARTVGKWYGNIRRLSTRLQSDIMTELQLLETQEQLKAELAKIRLSEANMQAKISELEHSIKHANMSAWHTDPDTPPPTPTPLTDRWFLLGDYDKRRRLPKAPFLPNYQADPLLYQTHQNQPNKDVP